MIPWQQQTLDITGKHCPVPVIRCRAALARLQAGQTLRVIATDPDCLREIPGLVDMLGEQLLGIEQRGHLTAYQIRRISGRRRRARLDQSSLLSKLLDLLPFPPALPAR